jgi:transposase
MSGVVTIGLDLAKSVFQIHGVDGAGRTMLRRRLSRHELVSYFAKMSPCLIGMEACSAAHHWVRELSRVGHSVRLIPPQYVKPYVKKNKTDAADAEAICEAVARPNMRYVPVKTLDQQDVLSLHRVRSLFVRQRTAAINTVRGLLTEFGIVAGKGIQRVTELRQRTRNASRELLPDEARAAVEEVFDHIEDLTARIESVEARIVACTRIPRPASGSPPLRAWDPSRRVPSSPASATADSSSRHVTSRLGLD